MNWKQAADEAKQRHRLTSDKQLAELLGISRQALSELRQNKMNFSTEKKLFLLHLIGNRAATVCLEIIAPEWITHVRDTLRAWGGKTEEP